MMTTQSILKNLRREYWALKMAFQATATNVKVTTKTLEFSTSRNACRQTGGGIAFDYEDNERVVLTLDTATGANTLAKLEIEGNFTELPLVRRVPYSGGARWIVTDVPRYGSSGWEATKYKFTLQTVVGGTLSARMNW